MIITDEDALICDMAEVYGIFNIYAMPADLIATLACGLRDSSRIKSRLLNMDMSLDDYLLAALFDSVNWLCWTHTKDAARGNNQPRRILDILMNKEEKKQSDDFLSFSDSESFEKERERLIRGIENG